MFVPFGDQVAGLIAFGQTKLTGHHKSFDAGVSRSGGLKHTHVLEEALKMGV